MVYNKSMGRYCRQLGVVPLILLILSQLWKLKFSEMQSLLATTYMIIIYITLIYTVYSID